MAETSVEVEDIADEEAIIPMVSREARGRVKLACIRLIGFKSFVDATEIPTPSNLVGIVGPNGCGKSNVIDAIRWVTGESMARNLRAEASTDVIFNGSVQRKPVGQAAVELVLNNPYGAIGGEYAKYEKIVIRRQINRDGQSSYFLNNTRCRRRDIADLLSGTGLGPRSYAIIGQGDVSRLIEAKPEEMRNYLEQAAGTTKIKDRRRETETRMRHTRENLERLEDIRDELGKQLAHLERQAEAAERFQTLKQEEHTYRTQLIVLRILAIDEEHQQCQQQLQRQQVELEAHIAEQRQAETAIELSRQAYLEQQDEFNTLQEAFYNAGSELAHTEQALSHKKQRLQDWQEELTRQRSEQQQLQQQLENERLQIEDLTEQQLTLSPEAESLRTRADELNHAMHQSEQAMAHWQEQWDEFNANAAKNTQQAEVAQTRIQHLEQTIEKSGTKLSDKQQSLDQTDLVPLQQQVETLTAELDALTAQQDQAEQAVQTTREQLKSKRLAQQDAEKELAAKQAENQRLQGRLSSLEALQQAALGQNDKSLSQWLAHKGLSQHDRLAQQFKVEAGWERAVETVLGDSLQALCVDDFTQFAEGFADLKQGCLQFISKAKQAPQDRAKTLLSKINGECAVAYQLAAVLIAQDWPSALAMQSQLSPGQSVITPEGLWLGPNWLRVVRETDAKAGIMARETELEQLRQQLTQLEETLTNQQRDQQLALEQITALEQTLDDQQSQVRDIARQQSDVASQRRVKQNQVEQAEQRKRLLQRDIEELHQQIEQAKEELLESRTLWDQAMQGLDKQATAKEQLQQQRETLRDQLQQQREQAKQAQQQSHEAALQLQRIHSELNATTTQHERSEERVGQLNGRCEELAEQILHSEEPIATLQLKLEECLTTRLAREEALAEAKIKLQAVEHQQRELEQQRGQAERHANELRDKVNKRQLQAQELSVRSETQREQLAELECDLETAKQALPEDAELAQWEMQLQRISNRIQRLGAINLAAIDEYAQAAERKNYLDDQHNDLMEALTALENAIKQIDKETRQRFKETFETVNKNFQTLFPKIFGGGSAYLELTGDDLLDTGVAVMARPPGKRNSTIHLLSGGEKALTAIALVFAIFQLNPAPFCLLDEVDAPLDDANVGRYIHLVKEMSKEIQFIFISHNKIAISMADQLAGVTMREPGVSRLVSVDIEQAIAMADA